jgi:L-amino acid N-acyltransferase YncA
MSPTIRLATPADLPAINDIYNYYVPRSTCTYQLEPETIVDRQAWFFRRSNAGARAAPHPRSSLEVPSPPAFSPPSP